MTAVRIDDAATWPPGEIARDIARGGLAGLVAGFLVAGVGGRVVMRLAAILVPSADGAFTENGNRVGDITVGGSVNLVLFVGLLGAIVFGVVWVVISPWLPGRGLLKGLVAMPVAIGLGAFGLVDGNNTDFFVLRFNPLVVASLIVLVALAPLVLAIADGWLERRLPRPSSVQSRSFVAYVVLALLGGSLGGLLLLQAATGDVSRPLGITVILVGLMTLLWWRERAGGREIPSTPLRVAASVVLVGGTVAGFALLAPELRAVLGIS